MQKLLYAFIAFILLSLPVAAQQKSLVLLVRLPEKVKHIENISDPRLRQIAIKERDDENLKIVDAFTLYAYGQVYFFYDTDSRLISGDSCTLTFVNQTLQRDSSIKFNCANRFAIAEFGEYLSDISGQTGPPGLVIYDRHFKNMKAPFPDFVPSVYGLYTYKDVVKKFNKRLKKFFRKYKLPDE